MTIPGLEHTLSSHCSSQRHLPSVWPKRTAQSWALEGQGWIVRWGLEKLSTQPLVSNREDSHTETTALLFCGPSFLFLTPSSRYALVIALSVNVKCLAELAITLRNNPAPLIYICINAHTQFCMCGREEGLLREVDRDS